MGLTASDWSALRLEIQRMLYKNIPEDLSSDDPRFKKMTGMDTKWLKDQWKTGSIVTSCNSFAGWVAREIGVPGKSVLAKGVLNISDADKEVPGCWTPATSAETIENGWVPMAGDFYSGPFPGQKWGHVGVVYDFDPVAQEWTLIQGGQGGPKSGRDFIKWKTAKFDRTKINGWVDIAFYMMPNGPAFSNLGIVHPSPYDE